MRKDWAETTLGEVTKFVRGPFGGSLKKEIFVQSGFAVYEQQHAIYGDFVNFRYFISMEKFNEMKRFSVSPGDLLMSCSGTVGKVSLVPSGAPAGIINQALLKISTSSQVLPTFLLYWTQSKVFHLLIKENSGGAVQQNAASVKLLKDIRITLPPLREQKRIVDLVSSVDAYIDALQQQVDTACTARNAVLHELLSAGGDDWTETTLGELCEIYQPETISKAKMDDSAPFVVYGANGPVGRYSRFNHEEPEVVVTCRGATCGVVNMTPSNCWITGNAMVVKPKDKRSTKGFLFWALQTTVDVQATISGSAQPQITRTGLAPSKIKVPPLVEQKRIVEIVSSMNDVIRTTEQAVVDAKNLRSGLLSDLLSGEHEIPESYDKFVGTA